MSKKLFIKTYGCQMNVYDSIKMGELLKPHGFAATEDQAEADMLILNTCHIREKAAEKVYSELGRIKKDKELKIAAGSDMVIAVAGCVAQAEGEEILRRAPYVDIVVGPQSYHNLPKLIEEVKRTKSWVLDLNFAMDSKFDKLPQEVESQGVSAFVSIQEGCDKFCNFCVVPYTRGAEYSRTVVEIIRETIALVAKGAREVNLLGQNVSAYHGAGPDGKSWTLARLIKELAKIENLKRIRYTTSHPKDMVDEELFALHATEKKLMPYLHLPVQSGSTSVLEAMNRKHSREFYLEVIENFKKARPDMAFSSDIIVGYPGETDEDFEQTMDMVRRVNYTQCYSFTYSPRPGTPASTIENQVPESIKEERLQRLQALIREQQVAFNQSCLGKVMDVLFEKDGTKDGQINGKTEYSQAVSVIGSRDNKGKVLPVRITQIKTNSLVGELVE